MTLIQFIRYDKLLLCVGVTISLLLTTASISLQWFSMILQTPKLPTELHSGGRLVFLQDHRKPLYTVSFVLEDVHARVYEVCDAKLSVSVHAWLLVTHSIYSSYEKA